MYLYSHSTQYSSKYSTNIMNSFNREAHALNTISQQLHHMGGACCLHDAGVQKLTLNMLCPFLTSPGEGRPQHYITKVPEFSATLMYELHEQEPGEFHIRILYKNETNSRGEMSVQQINGEEISLLFSV